MIHVLTLDGIASVLKVSRERVRHIRRSPQHGFPAPDYIIDETRAAWSAVLIEQVKKFREANGRWPLAEERSLLEALASTAWINDHE